MFVAANMHAQALQPSLFGAVSFNGGANWFEVSLTSLPIGANPAVAWDGYANLFMVYEDGTATQGMDVAVSLNGGTSFSLLTNLAPGHFAVEPRIAVGTGTLRAASGFCTRISAC